jgi:hypothetical protein
METMERKLDSPLEFSAIHDMLNVLRETMMESGEAYLSKIPVEVDVASGETRAEK